MPTTVPGEHETGRLGQVVAQRALKPFPTGIGRYRKYTCRMRGRGGTGRPGQGGRYERARGVTPARIETYPKRHQVSVDERVARLARSAVVRSEDFFLPPGTWADLHWLTTRSLDRSSRGGR